MTTHTTMMEFQFALLSLIISLFLLSVVLLVLINLKNSRRLPPGPTKLPIIGNLHNVLISGDNHIPRVFRDLAKRYGSFMHLKMGEISQIVVSSSDVAEEFLKTHDVNFAYRSGIFASKILTYDNSDIVFAPYGEYWRQMRKIVILELLSARKVKYFNRLRREEVCKMIDILTKAATTGTPVNLTQMFLILNNNIVIRSGFGTNLKHQKEFLIFMKEQVDLLVGFNISNYFPTLEKFLVWLTGLRKRTEKTRKNLEDILNTVIDEHHQKSKNYNNSAMTDKEGNNYLDILLNLQKKNDFGFEFTISNVKAIILDMFIAGTETTSTTLEWVISELVKNPEIMKKVTYEVRKTFKIIGTEADDYDNSFSKEMSYMQNVIKETLRLHPPAPLLVPHECKEKCQINGYDIDKKTSIIVNAWAIGRDPNKWEDSEVFKPERFMGNPIDFKGSHFDLIPFGSGKRICPGITFALANVELFLATILYHFNWKMPNGVPGEELDMTECVKGTLCRKHPLILVPVFSTTT